MSSFLNNCPKIKIERVEYLLLVEVPRNQARHKVNSGHVE
jgi:hypothetical protein